MKYRILFTEIYNRKARRFLRKHPDITEAYRKTLELLELDPFHPSLRLHKLSGKLSDLHSVSINLRYRISIVFLIEGNAILPVAIGSHKDVYRV